MVPVSYQNAEVQRCLNEAYDILTGSIIPALLQDMPSDNQTIVYHKQRVLVTSVPIIRANATIKNKQYPMWVYGTNHCCFIPDYAKSSSCSIF